jgi:alpha-N-arabinofuranosidase
MKKLFLTTVIIALFGAAHGQQKSVTAIRLYPEQAKTTINRNIYGQFAEHLGSCIYGGIWVGENSSIPNTNGYRNDVLQALRQLQIPVLRWPGGCFADEYHWRDGIGDKSQRPKMVNNNWGGLVEDNSFGTHEFLNLCELLGTEPYISGNVGSGTVEEMAKWVEYMTSDSDSPMANLRRQNGRDKPWKVKYLGVGNESWGCGGDMLPEFYADQYRRYAVYCRNFGNNNLFKIASGASDYDYRWTEVMMQKVGRKMHGLSLHYYTVIDWNQKGSATVFSPDEYYNIIGKSAEIEEVLQKHIAIMDRHDRERHIALMVDEWGTWFEVEAGTNPGFLYQQNTMRDALVAALTLNIFNRYPERIRMANIAQIVNVLQAMILTKDNQMTLTPTYHVFEMYKAHQDAVAIPLSISADTREIHGRQVPLVSASASQKDGAIHLTIANIDLDTERTVEVDFGGQKASRVSGRILTSPKITDHNTFAQPGVVKPSTFSGAKIIDGKLSVKLPAKSIIALIIHNV